MTNTRDARRGAVTLVLGDVEGSTPLWSDDPVGAARSIERLGVLVGDTVARHGGTRPPEQGEGDSFVVLFDSPAGALSFAVDLQLAIDAEPWPHGNELRMRLAVHTGDVVVLSDGRYAGVAFSRCARLRALAHGGQSLVSQATCDLLADGFPEGVTLLHLGSYELRGLTKPERVFQVVHDQLAVAFPPLRGLDAAAGNLPTATTALVGRASELAEVIRLVDDTRAVTLVGSGGVGKTRLALEAGRGLGGRFGDGVWWVDLSGVREPELVADVIAAALNVRERAGEPMVATLARQLRHQRALLIVDNCEHLLEACAGVVDAVLRECAGVHLLATSREPLALGGEVTFPVLPLGVPSEGVLRPEELLRYPAVELFVERARRVRPTFELTPEHSNAVASICRRVDGIPLALELAAVRVRLLAPAQIAAALNDRFRLLTGGARTAVPRQRTLEASVEWSYDLLEDVERAVLCRAAAFAGGFDLDAAEAVCADDQVDRFAVFDALAGLVDKSLVEVDTEGSPARYRLLETIRAYAVAKLGERDEVAAVRGRHLEHYVSVVERLHPELRGHGFEPAIAMLDRELDNIRAALEWALSSGEFQRHLRIASSLWSYWIVRSMFAETERTIAAALEASGTDARARARALSLASISMVMGGRCRHAVELAREAVEVAREAHDERVEQVALAHLGWSRYWIGEGGLEEITAASRMAAMGASEDARIQTLMFRGFLETNLHRPADGRAHLLEGLQLSERRGDRYWLGMFWHWNGQTLIQAGRINEARAALQSALDACLALHYATFAVYSLAQLAVCATLRGEFDCAGDLLDQARELAPEGGPTAIADQETERGFWLFARGDLVDARACIEAALSAQLDQGNLVEANYLRGLRAAVALFAGDAEVARSLAEDAVAEARAAGMRWQLGRALLMQARAHLNCDASELAEASAHEALNVVEDFGDLVATVDVLETLAAIAATADSPVEGARLLGAASRLRAELGYARFPVDEKPYQDTVARCRSQLDGALFDTAFSEGNDLSVEEAIAYARRGRGERRRPTAGWASLTPTELEVVRLVATGLSNPDIASKLFMSRNTVKTHLSHVFAKLDVASRAELAVEASRRQL